MQDDDLFFDLPMEDGSTVKFKLLTDVVYDGHRYALLANTDGDDFIIMKFNSEGNAISTIKDNKEYERVSAFVRQWAVDEDARCLYDTLRANGFEDAEDSRFIDLCEGMAVCEDLFGDYWKPIVLINHNTRMAYVFMDENMTLQTVTLDDIDWESVGRLSPKAQEVARSLSFIFPSFIRRFHNGVAEVEWTLMPDGRYWADEDGFGMTNDEEIKIYGYIDKSARVVSKFRFVEDIRVLESLCRDAERSVRNEQKHGRK